MSCGYCIGADNRILQVSDEWLAFARENQAPELTRERVLGRSIFAFISGAETEYLYYLLLDEVRSRRRAVSVPFRCDGASVRRFMRLELSPLEGEVVLCAGVLLKEEPRQAISFLDAMSARSAEAITICSWCKRVRVGEAWLDVESAVERLDLFRSRRLPQQNHGVCESCGGQVRDLVQRRAAG